MNSQEFTPEEVKNGLLNDLLKYLTSYNKKNKEEFFDIHITTDGYCTIVEWVSVSYDEKEETDRFMLVKSDEYIMTQVVYPDNSTQFCFPEEQDTLLKEWLEEHKNEGWEKSPNSNSWSSKAERDSWEDFIKKHK